MVHGDTDQIPFGMGTYGSRSLAVGGSAISKALDKIIAKGKKIAAHALEAGESDIDFESGEFRVRGTDKSVGFGDIALSAYVPHNYPLEELEPGLDEGAFYDPANFTFPAGCHICEVEVDPETGHTQIVNWNAVDDFGKIVNPMIVDGQVHGGIAHGVGQAMLENCAYDEESGQLLSGSLTDYCIPRADDLPSFHIETTETPCPHNPLGVKGCGEAGAIAAPAALINAITDALGVAHVDMPRDPGESLGGAAVGTRRMTVMYEFNYRRASSVFDAVSSSDRSGDASYLAGGMTLIPVLKFRLAAPSDLIDLAGLSELKGIRTENGAVAIGAMTTHAEVAGSAEVRQAIPALADLAESIGDPQVRNRGTIGGSIANADPAADYPAAVVGLGATVHTNSRTIGADDFFTDMFDTALEPGELVTAVSFPVPNRAAYMKFPNPASRYAIVGG